MFSPVMVFLVAATVFVGGIILGQRFGGWRRYAFFGAAAALPLLVVSLSPWLYTPKPADQQAAERPALARAPMRRPKTEPAAQPAAPARPERTVAAEVTDKREPPWPRRVTVQLPSHGTWVLTPVLLEPGATYRLKAKTAPPGEFEVSVHLDDQPEASWPTPAGLHVADSGFYLITTARGRLKYALQPRAPAPGAWTFTVEKTAVSAREHLEHRADPVYDASRRFGPQGLREPRG